MELKVPKLFVVPLKIVKISEQSFLGPYFPSEISHDMTKSNFGKILSHFTILLPYLTMRMATDLDKLSHDITCVS